MIVHKGDYRSGHASRDAPRGSNLRPGVNDAGIERSKRIEANVAEVGEVLLKHEANRKKKDNGNRQ